MAVYNEILVGRYNRFLQKLLSMKGRAAMNTLAPELFPTFPFRNGTENQWLEGWDSFGIILTKGAVAATFSMIQLRNPAGSGVIAVIEGANVFNAGGQADAPQLKRRTTNADLATLNGYSGSNLDARGRPAGSLILSSDNLAVVPTSNIIKQVIFPANGMAEFILYEDMQLPVLPGDAYLITSNNLNQNLSMGFLWRERTLEESERQ